MGKVAAVARRVNGDAQQVLGDGPPVVKKGTCHRCYHMCILVFGKRHAVRVSIFLWHHRKVGVQRVPYLWKVGCHAAIWAPCTHFNQ